ncbi:hypothetical protein ACFQX7_16325 [Luedemannella flava]
MALVRVYCGLAAAEVASWLTAAVVDDAGRLLEVRDISDDPVGYAQLAALLAERSHGGAPVAVAADRATHLVSQLLSAANRWLCIADDESSVDDFAERFADDSSPEEMESPAAERRAVGLARALQAGAVSIGAHRPNHDLDVLKPILAAHNAVIGGRHNAAVALREVLRELHPAALRAFPDPAEQIPLAVLGRLPEPSLLGNSSQARNRDAAVISEIAESEATDPSIVAAAVTALRVAVAESSPRRGAQNKQWAPVVAESVRQCVTAVRAFDRSAAVLVGTLVDRLGATGTPTPVVRSMSRAVAPSTEDSGASRVPAPRRRGAGVTPVSASPMSASPATGAPVSASPATGVPMSGGPVPGGSVPAVPFPAPPAPATYPAAPAASYPAAPAAASFPPASFPPASFPAAPGVAGFPVDPAAAYPVNPTNGGFAAGVGYPRPPGTRPRRATRIRGRARTTPSPDTSVRPTPSPSRRPTAASSARRHPRPTLRPPRPATTNRAGATTPSPAVATAPRPRPRSRCSGTCSRRRSSPPRGGTRASPRCPRRLRRRPFPGRVRSPACRRPGRVRTGPWCPAMTTTWPYASPPRTRTRTRRWRLRTAASSR